MRFLIDMNLSPRWVSFLEEAGFEAIHWSEAGEARAPDQTVMRWAAAHEHILITNDLDFSAILAATQRRKPSVVQIRAEQLSPKVIGAIVLSALKETRQDLVDGALVSVEVARTRVRVLPLRA